MCARRGGRVYARILMAGAERKRIRPRTIRKQQPVDKLLKSVEAIAIRPETFRPTDSRRAGRSRMNAGESD